MLILCCAVFSAYKVHDSFNDVRADNKAVQVEIKEVQSRFESFTYEEHKTSEIAQLVKDEGYRRCIYDDSRGLKTIGFGHLMLPTDTYTCITPKQAVALLQADYAYAENSVDTRYTWAYGEARLVLINMTYQMGQTGVSKFKKSLDCMRGEDYTCAAVELLDSRWAKQTSYRASRLAGRILAISVSQNDAGGVKQEQERQFK